MHTYLLYSACVDEFRNILSSKFVYYKSSVTFFLNYKCTVRANGYAQDAPAAGSAVHGVFSE